MIYNYRPDLYVEPVMEETYLTIEAPVNNTKLCYRWDTHGQSIEWGDGTTSIGNAKSVDNTASQTHTYASAGTYTIKIPAGTEFIVAIHISRTSSSRAISYWYPQPFCDSNYEESGGGEVLDRYYGKGNTSYFGQVSPYPGYSYYPDRYVINSISVPFRIMKPKNVGRGFNPTDYNEYNYGWNPLGWNNRSLSIELGPDVRFINRYAFAYPFSGDSSLSGVTNADLNVESFTFNGPPPQILSGSTVVTEDPFQGYITSSTVIYVPNEYLSAYKSTAPYSNYASKIIGV